MTLRIADVLARMRIAEVCEHGTRIVLWRIVMSYPPSDWNPSKCSDEPWQNAVASGHAVVVRIRAADAERVLDHHLVVVTGVRRQSEPLWKNTRRAV